MQHVDGSLASKVGGALATGHPLHPSDVDSFGLSSNLVLEPPVRKSIACAWNVSYPISCVQVSASSKAGACGDREQGAGTAALLHCNLLPFQ